MKILKRTKAMKDAHIAHGIRSFLTHFKIRERIDRMNQWALISRLGSALTE